MRMTALRWPCCAIALFLAGCDARAPVASSPAGETPPSPALSGSGAVSAPLPLKVSLNEVMVAMIDFAADGLWRPAASTDPLSDRQWLLVEQDATNLVAAATLLTSAGTGVNDEVWVADPDWRRWTEEMQTLALQARDAADQKDQPRLAAVGDRLVEVCEACHQAFKPGLPSMGVSRFPFYPKRDD